VWCCPILTAEDDEQGVNVPALVGGLVGGLAGATLLAVTTYICCRRRRQGLPLWPCGSSKYSLDNFPVQNKDAMNTPGYVSGTMAPANGGPEAALPIKVVAV
jgi:hypothetical protein